MSHIPSLILLLAPMFVLPAPHWSTNSALWGFYVWHGAEPTVNARYTMKADVGFPRIGVSNFQFTASASSTNGYYVLTAFDRITGLESDWSNEIQHTNQTVTLLWNWTVPPQNLPATNIVTIASGTNSLSLTNPWSKSQVYRLKNKTLQFALDPLGPWLNYTNWPGASNRLAIAKRTL